MEPVSTTIAAIAVVKGAVETAKNIKDIGNSLENLFSDHEREEKTPKKKKEKGKKKPSTRMQQVLRMRSGDEGYDDDTSISAVANKVLENKQKTLALQGLAKEIDKKIKQGKEGRLAGMIIGIKDNICYKDHKVTAASKILKNFVSLYS